MERPVRWHDYLTFNVYFLGLSYVSQTIGLVTPLLVAQFVGEQAKAGAYGTLRLWTLMTALLMQSLWGMLSDHSRLPWGRRRPFIFAGTLLVLGLLAWLGSLFGLQGPAGYAMLFIVSLLISAAANMPQAAAQAIIPDLAPVRQRGVFSGVKAVLEIPLPVILVSFTVGHFLAEGNTWAAVGAAAVILSLAMLLTMLVPETALQTRPPALDWRPFLRLLLMTAVFAGLILLVGQAARLAGAGLAPEAPLPLALGWMGLCGLAAMLAAVFGGVQLGVRIGLGGEDGGQFVDQSGEQPTAQSRPVRSAFTWWVVNRLAFLAGMVNLSTFALFYFQSRLGYSQMQAARPASQLIYVVGVMIFIAALLGGWLSDRVGHRSVLAFSGLAAAAGVAVLLVTTNLTVISIGGGLIGLAAGFFYTASWALGTSLAPSGQAARYLGIANLAGAGAGAIGAYVGGPIADLFSQRFPDSPGIGYVLLFAIYGLLFLFSALTVRGIRQAE